jgi:hypothetical protein
MFSTTTVYKTCTMCSRKFLAICQSLVLVCFCKLINYFLLQCWPLISYQMQIVRVTNETYDIKYCIIALEKTTYQSKDKMSDLFKSTGLVITCHKLPCVPLPSSFTSNMESGRVTLLASATLRIIVTDSRLLPLLISHRGDSGINLKKWIDWW